MRIVVAGATGDLGFRIVKALRARGASVVALHRKGAKSGSIARLETVGAEVATVDMANTDEIAAACVGAACVVSALAGLHDVIIGTQTALLDASIQAGVPRFIPSDFCTDWVDLPEGANRNLDLRRKFHERLNSQAIGVTSIRNGAFAEVLTYSIPIFNYKEASVGYWGDAEHRIDFTTMDDTAAFTAVAALDPSTPTVLRIASFQVSPTELVGFSEEVLGVPFKLERMGTLEELNAKNKKDRAAHPEGETELYPGWQRQQYLYTMLSVTQRDLANDRYPDIAWTGLAQAVPLKTLIQG